MPHREVTKPCASRHSEKEGAEKLEKYEGAHVRSPVAAWWLAEQSHHDNERGDEDELQANWAWPEASSPKLRLSFQVEAIIVSQLQHRKRYPRHHIECCSCGPFFCFCGPSKALAATARATETNYEASGRSGRPTTFRRRSGGRALSAREDPRQQAGDCEEASIFTRPEGGRAVELFERIVSR